MDLSVDHKPYDETEFSRITAAGGVVENGRINSNLNVSRALGMVNSMSRVPLYFVLNQKLRSQYKDFANR